MRILAHIFSILAFALSSLLTVNLLTSRAQGWLAVTLMALLGLVAEGGKGLLFYHGVAQVQHRRFLSGLCALAVSAFLIFLSILGTASAMNLTEANKRAFESRNSAQNQLVQSQINRAKELRAEADALGREYISLKRKLRNDAYALEQQALTAKTTEITSAGDYFDRIAGFLGISAAASQMLIFWGYGFALELIACLLAIMGLGSLKKEEKTQQRPVSAAPKEEKIENEIKIVPLKSERPFSTGTQKKAPEELRDDLKKYLKNALNEDRLLGLKKSGLSRAKWEKCVRALGQDQLIQKDHLGFKLAVPQETLWAWVG